MSDVLRSFALACVTYSGFATVAVAQVQSFMAEGNLEPSQDLGCVGFKDLSPSYTAADLMLSAQNCLKDENFDLVVESFIAMQVYGVYDAQRVSDVSAHQAVAVMGQMIADHMNTDQSQKFQEAVQRFGGEGSPRHDQLCGLLVEIGAPNYHPEYMIQHGQGVFLFPEADPIVEGFQPEIAWPQVLQNFLNCAVR